MVHIYVLKLEREKYYIGKTNNPQMRLENHFNSNGSAWTKIYKPLEIIEILSDCDDYDEDKYTIKYMEKYGINNVRGGSFCSIKLSRENINTIKQMIRGSMDKCYICGKTGHFANECKEDENEVNNDDRCFRCHRKGHYSGNCFARTYENGEIIGDNKIVNCYKCGRDGHYANQCHNNNNNYNNKKRKRDCCIS